jgi:hypothetical protein
MTTIWKLPRRAPNSDAITRLDQLEARLTARMVLIELSIERQREEFRLALLPTPDPATDPLTVAADISHRLGSRRLLDPARLQTFYDRQKRWALQTHLKTRDCKPLEPTAMSPVWRLWKWGLNWDSTAS